MRRYGFYHRYDTPIELELLNQLWPLVNDRLNYLVPTKKPIGYTTDRAGRRTRTYDKPKTPHQRLLDARVLSRAQETELAAYKHSLKPAAIATRIDFLQQELTRHAALKTRRLDEQTRPKLPNPAGIILHAS